MGRIDELVQDVADLERRKKELDAEHDGEAFPEEAQTEFRSVIESIDTKSALIEELRFRQAEIGKAAESNGNGHAERSGDFNVRVSRDQNDIFDLDSVRRNASSPQMETRMVRDNAMFAVERAKVVHPLIKQDDAKANVERLIRTTREAVPGDVARHILITGSDTYKRAFGKLLNGQSLNNEEQGVYERAFALTTTGIPIVWQLDPTVLRTSNYVINPIRHISRVETIAGTNEWRGVTSGAVLATYEVEATEAVDQTPTLTQPAVQVQRAQSFIPYSREVDQDVDNIQMEMAGLFQEAKDILEATQFYSGAGTTSFPQGIQTGLTNTQRVQTATTAVFVAGDLYALQNALPPRARNAGSQFIASLTQLNRIRALDTSGGSSLWVQLGSGLPGQLLGMEAYELSTFPSALTTTTNVMMVGDFSGGYLIVDRIGMEVELIPHLFGSSNRFPTGQRGLWAFWRNSAKVLDANRFRFLQVL
jgi:HK97 family phage major capsid protein